MASLNGVCRFRVNAPSASLASMLNGPPPYGVTLRPGPRMRSNVVKNTFERILGPGRNVTPYGGGPFSMDANDADGAFTLNLQTPFNDAIYAFTSAAII